MAVSHGDFRVMPTEMGIGREIRKDKTLSRLLRLNTELRDTSAPFLVSLHCCHFIRGLRLTLNRSPPLHPPAMTFDPQHLFPHPEYPVQFPHCPLPSSQVGESVAFPTELSNRQAPLGSGGGRSWYLGWSPVALDKCLTSLTSMLLLGCSDSACLLEDDRT